MINNSDPIPSETSLSTGSTSDSLTDTTPPLRPLTPESNMLATQLPSAIGGHMFSSPLALASKTPATIQMELQQLKAAPILNPHFRMVQR